MVDPLRGLRPVQPPRQLAAEIVRHCGLRSTPSSVWDRLATSLFWRVAWSTAVLVLVVAYFGLGADAPALPSREPELGLLAGVAARRVAPPDWAGLLASTSSTGREIEGRYE